MESISIFDIIKIGIGPSSSHTMGPWKAASLFVNELKNQQVFDKVTKVEIELFGSLALTGKGHGTDIAIIMGLTGEKIEEIDTNSILDKIRKIESDGRMSLGGSKEISFNSDEAIIFHTGKFLEFHPNGMKFSSHLENGEFISQTYYSVGGGFVVKEGENTSGEKNSVPPYPCHSAKDILSNCQKLNISFSDLVLLNEQAWRSKEEIRSKALSIWSEMKDCIFRGIHRTGELPGGLGVKRRAANFNNQLLQHRSFESLTEWIEAIRSGNNDFKTISSWVSCFALAVNEENASFGRVVTAPTNGASGVLPAVMMYAHCFENLNEEHMVRFILVAGEIGTIFKKNATISAAEGGCQAEIGVSSAMAAAGLAECLGGSTEQVMMAAEIAMEHHLGLTCDPIGGLVQIPCIERNSMGAIKAITACHIALQSDPSTAVVSLDAVVKTMWETAKNMHRHYKETSEGGLATNVAVNVVEC